MSNPSDPLVPHRWLTPAQAAEYIGVTQRTIRLYISRGHLSAKRIHGSRLIRIDRQDLDALMTPIPTASGGGRVA